MGGKGSGRRPAPLMDRFWGRVDKTESCWNWTGYVRSRYGGIKIGGRGGKMLAAHRLSWEFHAGPIPEGMVIDHVCHNTLCVNPDHLRAVTLKQNGENRKGASSNSKTGVRGVWWKADRSKYRASVGHMGKAIIIGHFDTLKEAEAAVVAKRNELHTHNDLDRIAS